MNKTRIQNSGFILKLFYTFIKCKNAFEKMVISRFPIQKPKENLEE